MDQSSKLRCAANAVEKAYGETLVLRGVTVEIPEGCFAVLVGPSGCGKSTLLRAVAGLEDIDRGSITIDGRDVTKLPPRDRDIAMVFQSYALYPHLTVRENLAFGLRLRKTENALVEQRVREASEMLGLEPFLDRFPKQLSGGQRQRVAMGRAIVRRPKLFLFDEPLSNLDAALRGDVRVQIKRLHESLGATMLYVTHDQVEAMTLADRLFLLRGGHVEQSGPPLELYERPRTTFAATFLGAPAMNLVPGKLAEKDGVFRAEGDGFSVEVDRTRFGDALAHGRVVTTGLRPQDLRMPHGDEPALRLRVELTEALGFETYAHGTVAGERFVVRLEGSAARTVHAKEMLPLAIAKENVHLFDPQSGLALDVR